MFLYWISGLFRSSPLPQRIISPLPVEAVASAASVFTEYVFCESIDSARNSKSEVPSKKLTACWR